MMPRIIPWYLYEPGLNDGTLRVLDVVAAESCHPQTVYDHCHRVGIRLKGKRRPFKKYLPSYLDEVRAGIRRYGSKRAMIRHFEEYGWY